MASPFRHSLNHVDPLTGRSTASGVAEYYPDTAAAGAAGAAADNGRGPSEAEDASPTDPHYLRTAVSSYSYDQDYNFADRDSIRLRTNKGSSGPSTVAYTSSYSNSNGVGMPLVPVGGAVCNRLLPSSI
jgi:hypothetical protein